MKKHKREYSKIEDVSNVIEKIRVLFICVFLVAFLFFLYFILKTEIEGKFFPKEIYDLIEFATLICGGLFIIAESIYRIYKKYNEINNAYAYRKYLVKRLETYTTSNSKKEDDAVKKSTKDDKEIVKRDDNKDIIALMLKNNDEITEYFRISKSQAKSSFWFSVISCVVGLLALLVGIYGIVILKDVSVSVISLISGSISELISGTIFWVHNKSALQLNHYYDALHENEKFLSAVNIADRLSADKREEVLVEIIRKQISAEFEKIKKENVNE